MSPQRFLAMNIKFLATGIITALIWVSPTALAQYRIVTRQRIAIQHPTASHKILRILREELPPIQSPEPLPQYIWPVQGTVSSGYGPRWGRMHRGIDIAAPTGTPVVAAASGVVSYSGWHNGGYGNLVDIKHPDGSLTRYAHNSQVLVQQGQKVEQGQLIALVGSTGRSTGPHSHFEIHAPGEGAIDPMAFLPQLQ